MDWKLCPQYIRGRSKGTRTLTRCRLAAGRGRSCRLLALLAPPCRGPKDASELAADEMSSEGDGALAWCRDYATALKHGR